MIAPPGSWMIDGCPRIAAGLAFPNAMPASTRSYPD